MSDTYGASSVGQAPPAAADDSKLDELDEVLEEFSAFKEASSQLERSLRQQIADRDAKIAALLSASADSAAEKVGANEATAPGGKASGEDRLSVEELQRRNVQLENDLLRLERQIREDDFTRTKLVQERDNAIVAKTVAEEERVTLQEELLAVRRKLDEQKKQQSVTEDWLATVLSRLKNLLSVAQRQQ